MEIFKCGTPVIIKLANIKGIITCASLRYDEIRYEITYYDGLLQRTIWVHEDEFENNTEKAINIGFKK